MTQIQGSFVLTRDIQNDEIVNMSDVRARAIALTDLTRPKITATLQRMRNPVVNSVYLSTSLSSDGEDEDNSMQKSQTTTRTLFPDDDLYDSDLDFDNENETLYNYDDKELYLSNCKQYGTLPSSILMKMIDRSNPSIVVRSSAMKPLDIKVLVLSLKMSTIITKLDLSGNGFGSMGAMYLAKFMKYNEYVTELNLSDNDIGQKGCKVLCDALVSCRSIKTLILDGNRLDDKCAVYLADLFTSNEYLLYVSLAKNFFENISTATALSQALADNQSIETFNISFNHFHQKTISIFIKFLSKNSRLRTLNLAYSSFGLDASKALFLAMQTKTTQLEELDLSSNCIDDECAKYLGGVLSTNESLKKLYLMQNPLSVRGCLAILKPLKTMPTTQLEIIDIRDMNVKSQDFIDLANDLEARFEKFEIRRGEKIVYPPPKKNMNVK